MKAGLGTLGSRLPTRQYLWVAISALLFVGMLSTLVDLLGVSHAQTLMALEQHQRVIINAQTGVTSDADQPQTLREEPPTDFEVGEAVDDAPVESEAPAEADVETEPSVVAEASSNIPEDDAPALATSPLVSDIPKIARTKNSLILAPAPEVSEITPQGALPKRADKDTTPASIYSHNYVRKDNVATLHLVVMGLGFGSDTLSLALDLPSEVSFSFSPYGDALTEAIEASRNAGHEVWVQLPMQTANYPQDDPGPLGLISTLSMDVFEARFKKILIAMPGAVGVILPRDETLSGMSRMFSIFLEQLDARGLLALTTHPSRSIRELSSDKKLQKMIAKSDMVLDSVPSESVIKSKLAGLIDETKKRRQLVVLMHARPQTLILVQNWLKRISHEGVELAPLSATILRPPKMLTPDDVEAKPKDEGGHGAAKPASGHGGGH